MSNPLLTFWHRLFVPAAPRRRTPVPVVEDDLMAAAAPVFLVLRRMRAPLIVLILIFAVSVLGLTLVPGTDAAGQPHRLGFFDAFYFMSYTATTIGFGEIPYPFSVPQRMWVTFSIYLAVVGWAYAIGMMLALLQDRAFRQAIATERFRRSVAHLPEPFQLLAGYGRTGQLVARALDAAGRRLVVLDIDPGRIDVLDLEALTADVPALAADARVPANLVRAGLLHERCAGVLALTDDDEANLAVVIAADLLRPGLPVIARSESAVVSQRMTSFGEPEVVNPYDDFGDHLRVALNSPTVDQVRQWLTGAPGGLLPDLLEVPPPGRWVVLGATRLAEEVTRDLREAGLPVETTAPGPDTTVDLPETVVVAVGLVAATDSDTLNLSVVEDARRRNPGLFVVAQQIETSNGVLYRASRVDLVLVEAEVVAHEVLARLASPVLWQFLRDLAVAGEQVAQGLRDRLVAACGERSPALWPVSLTEADAPAVVVRLAEQPLTLGDLLRSPADRDEHLPAVPLVLTRDSGHVMLPDEDVRLAEGDSVLLAGEAAARRAVGTSLIDPATAAYVLSGAELATTWVGRALTRSRT